MCFKGLRQAVWVGWSFPKYMLLDLFNNNCKLCLPQIGLFLNDSLWRDTFPFPPCSDTGVELLALFHLLSFFAPLKLHVSAPKTISHTCCVWNGQNYHKVWFHNFSFATHCNPLFYPFTLIKLLWTLCSAVICTVDCAMCNVQCAVLFSEEIIPDIAAAYIAVQCALARSKQNSIKISK